jgi:GNAT superfamily N-acetyltransferase
VKIVPLPDGKLEGIWPQFLLHDRLSNRYWNRIYTEFPGFQFALVEGDELIAEGNCVPVAGRPAHWRDAFPAAFDRGGEPDRVCALAIMVAPEHRNRGVARVMLEHMRSLAAPFGQLVAPVRPTLKERYPLIPIAEYASWRRADGSHVDPWIRTHERLGAELLDTAEEAMLIEGSETEWHDWTGLDFPGDGEYVVPGALAPVRFADGRGVYREPCVWLRHDVT